MFEKIQMIIVIALALSLIADVYFNYKDVRLKKELIKSNENVKTLLERFFRLIDNENNL